MNDVIAEHINLLEKKVEDFLFEAKKVTNKAAARRARKLSMELRTMLKEFKIHSLK